jgi:parvulin-like peptidyl-prolyl isomerase
VEWNEVANEVIISGEKEVKLTIGQLTAFVDGEAVALDCAPVLVSGRTFVPLRFVSEAFGYNVQYVASTEQVVVDDSPLIYDFGENIVTVREIQLLCEMLRTLNGETMGNLSGFMEAVCMASWFSELFPELSLNENDCAAVRANIEESNGYMQPKLHGMHALLQEKLYLINSDVLRRCVLETNDLESIYQQNYVCAKHVLVDDEATAWAVYSRAVVGTDFNSLIKQYGKDPGMEAYPQGYVFTKGEMVESFEKATYGLKDGEISEPVKSEYGYHVIQRQALPKSMPDETLSGIVNQIQVQRMMEKNLMNPQMLIEPELLLELLEGKAEEV